MVIICIGGRLILSMFSLQLVIGNGSSCGGPSKCCSGYKWDRNAAKCLLCPTGYVGEFCDVKCRYPGFGVGCQDECLCEQEKCDPVKGCQDIVKERVTTPAPKYRMAPNSSISPRHDYYVNRSFTSRDTLSAISPTPDMQKDLVNNSLCLETSIESDAASMWKTLNEKGRGMVIGIATLGLLFLILTVMYIWVSHRLRLETNNLKKETEDLDENSLA